MPGWLSFLCVCIRPDAKQAILDTGRDDCIQGSEQQVKPSKPGPFSLAEHYELSTRNADQASGTYRGDQAEMHARELPAASISRRKSSSTADTLAPLAEDEILTSSDQGNIGGANRKDWTEASRSSCPTLATRGCLSSANIEPAAGAMQPVLRPHSLAAVPKNSSCVSQVYLPSPWSLASPMRHDFMTLMRQASTRVSSCGLAHDSTGLSSPHPWSLGPLESCHGVGVPGSQTRTVEWTPAAAALRQGRSGDAFTAQDTPCHHQQRRALAFAAPGIGARLEHCASVGAVTTSSQNGDAVGSCPPCPQQPAGAAASAFARCSSSPDIRANAMFLESTNGRVWAGLILGQLVQLPSTAPPSIGHTANGGDTSCCKNDCGVGGTCSASGGSGLSVSNVMQQGTSRTMTFAGRNGPELRSGQGSTPSPLRPRDLPPPLTPATSAFTTTAALAAAAAATSMRVAHSASALPKYHCHVGSGCVQSKPKVLNSLGSYQQVRLLQQLKEQHERTTAAAALNAAALGAATAAALAAKEMEGSTEISTVPRLQPRPETAGGGMSTEAITWVEAYFSTEPVPSDQNCPKDFAVATGPAVSQRVPVHGVLEQGVTTDSLAGTVPAAGTAEGTMVVDGDVCASAENCRIEVEPSAPLAEDSNVLVADDSPSGELPSISAFLAPALGTRWIGRSCCCTATVSDGIEDSWVTRGGGSIMAPPTAIGRDQPGSVVVEVTEERRVLVSRCDRNSTNIDLQEAMIVGSLRETLDNAMTEFGSASAGRPSQQASVVPVTSGELEAMIVIQNLLQRNALPDDSGQVTATAGFNCTEEPLNLPSICEQMPTVPSVFEAFHSQHDSRGHLNVSSGRRARGSPHLVLHGGKTPSSDRNSFQSSSERLSVHRIRQCSSAAIPASSPRRGLQEAAASSEVGRQSQGMVRAASYSCLGTAVEAESSLASKVPCRDRCSQPGVREPLSPAAITAAKTTEPLMTLLSRIGPTPDSLRGSASTSRSGAAPPFLISPLRGDHAKLEAEAPEFGSRSAVAAAAALLLPGPNRLATDAANVQTPSTCSPLASHLWPSPTYMVTASPPGSFRREPMNCRIVFGVGDSGASPSEPDVPPAGNCSGVGESASWVAAFGGPDAISSCGALTSGVSGVLHKCASLNAYRESNVLASGSNLTAIALLRSAASNGPLPDDGGSGCSAGVGLHIGCMHAGVGCAGEATTTAGGSLMGFDTDGPLVAAVAVGSSSLRSVTASTVDPSTAETARSMPMASLFNSIAWPQPPTVQQQPSLTAGPQPSSPSRPPALLQSLHPTQTAAPQTDTQSSTQNLRLEDGLIADPLLLIDGLCQLSYVTSGAYAAVYRGTLEGMPVGIKFLASTSLDLHAPAVKEALLGPGLEHENIIRTYTTRVTRVDRRAVAQLRAIAAAMTAAVAMQRKRSSAGARRYSSCNPTTSSPLSVPSPPLSSTSAVTSAAVAQRRTTYTLQSPLSAGTSSIVSPGHILQSSPQTASLAVAPTVPNVCSSMAGGNSHTLAAGVAGCLQQLGQMSPAKHVVKSPRGMVADSAPCNAIFSAADSPTLHAQGGTNIGRELKWGLVSMSGELMEHSQAETMADNPSGNSLAAAAASASGVISTRRQLYIRKSVSANARAGISEVAASTVSDADLIEEAAGPPPPPRLSPPAPLRLLSSRCPVLQAGSNSACRVPSRRCSTHLLTDGRHALWPRFPQQPSHPAHLLPVGGPRTHIPASVQRNGSAAEQMLHVLGTLGVLGPTGQITADAHYVTAVVMEFADAGNLDSFSRSTTPCDLATAVDLLRQVARGMSYLHAHGLVHGDLKPANVLVSREPSSGRLVAKVADFGLSGLSGQLGTSGGADTCGTVAYSAPERLAEEEGAAEQAADMYSFGICMQQLVSGVRPFADLTFGQVMFSVLCLKTRPSWPEGRCGALKPLYDMCCDPVPAQRPTFDQVVSWLDSLWPVVAQEGRG